MGSAFSWTRELGPAGFVLQAILVSLAGIVLLIAFIVARRWRRGLYFRRRSERTFALRQIWDDIVSGRVASASWRFKSLDCEIVEAILLDNIEVASAEQLPPLLGCLRSSGLLDMRIHQARATRGWRRRIALVALGRTRAVEAIPALAEALDAKAEETRIAAVRGLGRIGVPQAALPMLERFVAGQLHVPEHTLKNALVSCCQASPGLLVNYLENAGGRTRELLARVLGEVAAVDLGDELLVLAGDPLPEVRASVARALAKAQPAFALPLLAVLASDAQWFVRLRAVVALDALEHPGRIKVLLRAVCDPNRLVRQRAAWVLVRMEPRLEEILDQVVATHDNYALQAFISELERSGALAQVTRALQRPSSRHSAAATLLEALAAGRKRVARTAAAGE